MDGMAQWIQLHYRDIHFDLETKKSILTARTERIYWMDFMARWRRLMRIYIDILDCCLTAYLSVDDPIPDRTVVDEHSWPMD